MNSSMSQGLETCRTKFRYDVVELRKFQKNHNSYWFVKILFTNLKKTFQFEMKYTNSLIC